MQSSNKINPLSKNDARKTARSVWKDFLQDTVRENLLLETMEQFVSTLSRDSRILAFISMNDEPDIMSILEKNSFKIYIPFFDRAGNMDFSLYIDAGIQQCAVHRGPYGIMMPEKEAERLALPLDESDTVFVPSLASNPNGCRLGRGGGYYDRWKNRFSNAFIAGMMPSELSGLNFPEENHDLHFSSVITEKGIVDYK